MLATHCTRKVILFRCYIEENLDGICTWIVYISLPHAIALFSKNCCNQYFMCRHVSRLIFHNVDKKKMLLKTCIYLSKMCSIFFYFKRGNSGWRSYVLAQGPLGIELDLYMYDSAKLNRKKLQQRLTFKGCLKRQCFAKEWSTF